MLSILCNTQVIVVMVTKIIRRGSQESLHNFKLMIVLTLLVVLVKTTPEIPELEFERFRMCPLVQKEEEGYEKLCFVQLATKLKPEVWLART